MKTGIIRKLGFAAIVAGLGIAMAVPAHATLMIRLTQGLNQVTVTDQGAGDSNPLAGVVTFVGSVGTFYSNVSSGTSDPVTGSPTSPLLDLSSQNIGGSGSITIELTDTDFNALSPIGFSMDIGGTLARIGMGNSVNYDAYFDAGNNPFATTTHIGNIGPFSASGFFGGATAGAGPLSGLFSVTQVVVVTHGGTGRTSSFDAELRAVPEPGTLALFGMSILGFGVALRRRLGRSA